MRWILPALFFCAALLLGTPSDSVAAEETPTHLEGVTIVTSDDLRPMLGKGVRVYDLRKKASYVDGHVPGAESAAEFYDANDTSLDTSFLSPNRSDAIVFYSHGSTGWKSYWAARRAVEAGYNNVMWMRGGYEEWSGRNHPIAR
jgi:rhodanese-related sulfurtransferase